jgi:hypothetical protein
VVFSEAADPFVAVLQPLTARRPQQNPNPFAALLHHHPQLMSDALRRTLWMLLGQQFLHSLSRIGFLTWPIKLLSFERRLSDIPA